MEARLITGVSVSFLPDETYERKIVVGSGGEL